MGKLKSGDKVWSKKHLTIVTVESVSGKLVSCYWFNDEGEKRRDILSVKEVG